MRKIKMAMALLVAVGMALWLTDCGISINTGGKGRNGIICDRGTEQRLRMRNLNLETQLWLESI